MELYCKYGLFHHIEPKIQIKKFTIFPLNFIELSYVLWMWNFIIKFLNLDIVSSFLIGNEVQSKSETELNQNWLYFYVSK